MTVAELNQADSDKKRYLSDLEMYQLEAKQCNEEINRLMKKIIEESNIKIENIALEKIKSRIITEKEKIGQMISKMEKIYIYQENQPINFTEIEQMTSNIKKEDMDNYIDYVKKKDLQNSIHMIQQMEEKGYSVIDILDHLYNYIKETTHLTETQKYNIIPLICKYITIFNKIHEDHIELAIFTNELIATI